MATDDGDYLPNFQDYASQPKPGAVKTDDMQWGMYAHLSALLGIPLGGLMFLGPLVCLFVKKPMTPYIEANAKEALNFQINIAVLFLLTLPLAFVTSGISLILSVLILIYSGVMAILIGVKAGEGREARYPAIVRVWN
ncbi:MAG: DUF4870 domain-containing protein [Gemmataceae bacterium]|nr:DUF4870 domain-containing protein [Gemmataceae bacterium]